MNRSPSTRIERCRHFGICGSCDALDQDYAWQLQRKASTIRGLFADLAPQALEGLFVQASPQVHRYRNKLIYPVHAGGTFGIEAGYYRPHSHDVVDIHQCQIQEACLTTSLNALRRALLDLRLEPYDQARGRGSIRALFGRVGTGSGEMMLGVVTRGGVFEAGSELVRRTRQACQGLVTERGRRVELVSFMHSLNDAPGNRLLGTRSLPLWGRSVIRERLGRVALEISMNSFYQVNAGATALLYRGVERALGGDSIPRLVEAYAGIGSLALWLAPRARELWTIEVSRSAVRDARRNFAAAGLSAERILEGSVEERLGVIPDPIDVLVVDPPRAGLSPTVLEAITQRLPARLIYVSCNAVTLARDGAALLAAGYQILPLQAFDLFPHTPHVELLATFVRGKSSS